MHVQKKQVVGLQCAAVALLCVDGFVHVVIHFAPLFSLKAFLLHLTLWFFQVRYVP